MPSQKRLFKNIQRYIKVTEKEVTILFTDVVASSTYWDSRGDVMGRLMIDFLNRMIFPIIQKNNGRIVKTIGDSVMASFKSPTHALHASIAIQQALQHERKSDPKIPKICIGIHSGRAVVEKGDIYGDTVNVASRIEDKANANEILISARAIRKLNQKSYHLEKKGRFTPRGKKNPMTLYKCVWQKASEVLPDDGPAMLRLGPIQKWEILGAGLVNGCMLVFLYFRYIRYFLADSEALALILLNPKHLVMNYPLVAVLLGLLLIGVVFLIIRSKFVPMVVFRILSGGVGFCLSFILFFAPTVWLSLDVGLKSDVTLHASNHLFVEIKDTQASIREQPSEKAPVIRSVPRGMLLLLTDVAYRGEWIWNKVLIDRGTYGWVPRVQPPQMGVAEKRISLANKFYFRVRDIYNFLVGIIGFIFGFFRFKLRAA
ncbi:hypothetical protein HQ585_07975 [candidate division KSB1 bacterium]|nr:hypothetical protein [candidate division KSB1 bacterium]